MSRLVRGSSAVRRVSDARSAAVMIVLLPFIRVRSATSFVSVDAVRRARRQLIAFIRVTRGRSEHVRPPTDWTGAPRGAFTAIFRRLLALQNPPSLNKTMTRCSLFDDFNICVLTLIRPCNRLRAYAED